MDSSGSPARTSSPLSVRAAHTIAIRSASRRRATKPSTWAEAWSSHCASSTMQTSGCCSATSANSVSVARPTRKRSGAGPALSPNTVASASRCGAGRPSSRSSIGAQSLMEPAVGQLHLRLDAHGPRDVPARDAVGQVVQQRALAHARLPPQDDDSTPAGERVGQQPVERFALAPTSEQLRRLTAIVARGRPPSPFTTQVVATRGGDYISDKDRGRCDLAGPTPRRGQVPASTVRCRSTDAELVALRIAHRDPRVGSLGAVPQTGGTELEASIDH